MGKPFSLRLSFLDSGLTCCMFFPFYFCMNA